MPVVQARDFSPGSLTSYFLVVADICRHARDNKIPLGPGRGSCTGSIVAYATRITELCPLRSRTCRGIGSP